MNLAHQSLNLADMRQGPEHSAEPRGACRELQLAPSRFSSTDPTCWAEWKPPAKPQTPNAFLRDLGCFLLKCAGKLASSDTRLCRVLSNAQSRAKLWEPCQAFAVIETVVARMSDFAPTPTDRADWFAASSAKRALILASDLWREWYIAKSWTRQHSAEPRDASREHGGERRAFATFVKAKLCERHAHYCRLDHRAYGILAQVFASAPLLGR